MSRHVIVLQSLMLAVLLVWTSVAMPSSIHANKIANTLPEASSTPAPFIAVMGILPISARGSATVTCTVRGHFNVGTDYNLPQFTLVSRYGTISIVGTTTTATTNSASVQFVLPAQGQGFYNLHATQSRVGGTLVGSAIYTGLSRAGAFQVLDPLPVISAISPTSAPPGSDDMTLTVTGEYFSMPMPSKPVPSSYVYWNNIKLYTKIVSTTQLMAIIPAYLTILDDATVTVHNVRQGQTDAVSNRIPFNTSAHVLAGVPTARVDADLDGIDDRLETTLANLYAPILFLSPFELNYPITVDAYLGETTLQYREAKVYKTIWCEWTDFQPSWMPSSLTSQRKLLSDQNPGQTGYWLHPESWGPGHLPFGQLTHLPQETDPATNLSVVEPDPEVWRNQGEPHRPIQYWQLRNVSDKDVSDEKQLGPDNPYYLCGRSPKANAPDPYRKGLQGVGVQVGDPDPSHWVTYVHEYPNRDGGINIQYWHFFAYDDFSQELYDAPCCRNDFNHGGDWDAEITVKLNSRLQPLGAWYRRHQDDAPGTFFAWPMISVGQSLKTLHTDGTTHPIVMLDAGGHGSFVDPNDLQDFYRNHLTYHISLGITDITYTTSWKDSSGRPLYSWCDSPLCYPYGTYWETWDGGRVWQASGAAAPPDMQPLYTLVNHPTKSDPATSGGIINLGEYNTGVKTGTHIAEGLGESTILNNQIFLEYSGLWGEENTFYLGLGEDPQDSSAPRGPVFGGWDSGLKRYNEWYNEAAPEPASRSQRSLWLYGPTTKLSTPGSYTSANSVTYVSGTTRFYTLVSNPVYSRASGLPSTYYRFYRIGAQRPAFRELSQSAGSFSISGSDGNYQLEYLSVDSMMNREPLKSASYVLDTTPPITGLQSQKGSSGTGDSQQVTLTSSDSDGSGVAATYYTVDGGSQQTYTGPFTVPGGGSHTVTYWSVDNVKHEEAHQTSQINPPGWWCALLPFLCGR